MMTNIILHMFRGENDSEYIPLIKPDDIVFSRGDKSNGLYLEEQGNPYPLICYQSFERDFSATDKIVDLSKHTQHRRTSGLQTVYGQTGGCSERL